MKYVKEGYKLRYKLLIIDDDGDTVKMLKDYFEMQDYIVYTAYNGTEALEKLEIDPDVILLDINMPGKDGYAVCKIIRSLVECPILFLTARAEENDAVKGFMVGGDDYIRKPYRIRELGMRVKAHICRDERVKAKKKIKFSDGLLINYSNCNVCFENKKIDLTTKEFEILALLSSYRGQIFSQESIYEKIWNYDRDGDSKVVRELISRIRKKLEKHTGKKYIENVWGHGYKWEK
ncbi:response regulator transcription factor [Lachnospiraceae bacterium ZAX-1]